MTEIGPPGLGSTSGAPPATSAMPDEARRSSTLDVPYSIASRSMSLGSAAMSAVDHDMPTSSRYGETTLTGVQSWNGDLSSLGQNGTWPKMTWQPRGVNVTPC